MITAVWGRADSFDVIFTPSGAGDWRVSVPPDLSDGQYAVEIWAENDAGEQAYWTGTLYMVDSVLVCLHLTDDPYTVWLLPDRCEASVQEELYGHTVKPDRYSAALMDELYTAELSRRQCHV